MSEEWVIQSHKGPYGVYFEDTFVPDEGRFLEDDSHFLIDANVARLYEADLHGILQHPNTIIIEATEENKSIEQTIPVVARVVQNGVRRDHTLVAIGGGIIQDVTCFIASTLLRGLPWTFLPTTLLAQADSCIGSKSSINLGDTKNILGTFHPPQNIFVYTGFLETLEHREVQSGVGEIIKVHAIDGIDTFDRFATDFDRLFLDRAVLRQYILSALHIKKRFIEEDEFDRGIRNVFNYGHSFGHAIESATCYAVPHGIAVSIGMDMANFIAVKRGLTPEEHYTRMHTILSRNYADFATTPIPFDTMISALMKDKKNTTTMLGLILPIGEQASIQPVQVSPDESFRSQCKSFLGHLAAHA